MTSGRIFILLLVCTIYASKASSADIKTALVIGNNTYQLAPLLNSVKDATAVSKELKALGFEVELVTNAPFSTMAARFDEFSKKISGTNGVVAVIYYSGHAMQRLDRNLLLATDVKLDAIDKTSFDIQEFLSTIKPASESTYLVILDACREYSHNQGKQGLAPVDAPPGTLIAFSTGPGRLASDGDPKDGNGIYTKHLIKHLKTPGIPVESVFKKVRASVITETKGDQVPWENSSMLRDYYFLGAPVGGLATSHASQEREVASDTGGSISKLSVLYEVLDSLSDKSIVSSRDIESLNSIFKPAYGIEVNGEEARFLSAYVLSLGIHAIDIPQFIRARYGIRSGIGVIVAQSDGSGLDKRIGVQNGDIVLAINGKEVHSGEDFRDVLELQSHSPGEIFSMTLLREGNQIERSAVLERSATDTLILTLVVEWLRQENFPRARELLEGLASIGNPRAMGLLAKLFFENSHGFEGNKFDLAFDYATKSARLGDLHGESILTLAYDAGRGTDTNKGKAIDLMAQYASKGENWALGMLAARYLKGDGIHKDYEKSRTYAERGAYLGDHNSATVLALLYANGFGVEKSKEMAIQWYSRSLEIVKLYKMNSISEKYEQEVKREIRSLSQPSSLLQRMFNLD
jgi:hypothetical protein